jgi:GH24 family phage-related lysozyme (muramidase)
MDKRKFTRDGLELVKYFEGFYPTAYLCPAKVPTIGYGHTTTVTKGDVSKGLTINKTQAELLLAIDLEEFENAVDKLVSIAITDYQFSALVSFAFNVGAGNLGKSTLLKLLNKGNYTEAQSQFLRWNKAAGRVLPGLTLRRKAEYLMFGNKNWKEIIC